MKKIATALLFGAFIAGSASAQDAGVKDLNGDGMIDRAEYQAANEGRSPFKMWDKNNDGAIDTAEFDEGEFMAFDDDRDGNLNAEEAGRLNQSRINRQSTP